MQSVCFLWPGWVRAQGHSWPTQVQTDKRGSDTWLYQVLTQEQDMQPEREMDSKKVLSMQVNTPSHTHMRKSLLYMTVFPKRQSVCVRLCVSACLCVQTVGGAGTGDSEKRGMRHCIKLWTSVPHRNHKAGAEETERITSLSLTHLITTSSHTYLSLFSIPYLLRFPPSFCIIINIHLFPHFWWSLPHLFARTCARDLRWVMRLLISNRWVKRLHFHMYSKVGHYLLQNVSNFCSVILVVITMFISLTAAIWWHGITAAQER